MARSLVLVTRYVIRGRMAGCGLALWHICTLCVRHVSIMWRVCITSVFHPWFSVLLVIILVWSRYRTLILKPLGLRDVYVVTGMGLV